MAVWDFRVSLIPIRELKREFGGVPDSLSLDRFDGHEWWPHEQKDRIAGVLTAFLGNPPLSEGRMSRWVLGPHTIALFWSEKSCVTLVTSKADARERCEGFFEKLVDIAKALDCALYASSRDVVLPDLSRLIAAFERSLAHRFLLDPNGALRDPIHLEIEKRPPEKDL